MDLGDRMKQYEHINRNYLLNRVPMIIRIDGKAFHTFTKGMKKPFDSILQDTMQATMKYLCENIQGAVFGYTQSDEITIFMYSTNRDANAWFDGNIQKIVSVAASMATLYFNKFFKEHVEYGFGIGAFDDDPISKIYCDRFNTALFDARVFNVPNENEARNCLIWRQLDATKNSVQMLAQYHFPHKELQGLHGGQLQDKLMLEKSINWNDQPTKFKRGSSCVKREVKIKTENTESGIVIRKKWFVDNEMPIITQKPEYFQL